MIKLVKILHGAVIFTLLAYYILNSGIAFAINPTPEDFTYAKTFMSAYATVQKDQLNLENQIKAAGPTLNSAKSLKPYFDSNLKFVGRYYAKIYSLKPTPTFAENRNAMLNTVYSHLNFLKQTVDMCNKDVDFKTFSAQVQKKGPIVKNYERDINAFITIVQSWPSKYSSEVMGLSK